MNIEQRAQSIKLSKMLTKNYGVQRFLQRADQGHLSAILLFAVIFAEKTSNAFIDTQQSNDR